MGHKTSKILRQPVAQGQPHAPIKPLVLPTLSVQCRHSSHRLNTQNLCSLPGGVADDHSFNASEAISHQQRKQEDQKRQLGVTPQLARGNLWHTDDQATVEQIQTIPHPRFVRSLPTLELQSIVEEENPQKFMVKQPKRNIPELQFEVNPDAVDFHLFENELQD